MSGCAVAPTLTLPRWAGEGTAAGLSQRFYLPPPPSGGGAGWGKTRHSAGRITPSGTASATTARCGAFTRNQAA